MAGTPLRQARGMSSYGFPTYASEASADLFQLQSPPMNGVVQGLVGGWVLRRESQHETQFTQGTGLPLIHLLESTESMNRFLQRRIDPRAKPLVVQHEQPQPLGRPSDVEISHNLDGDLRLSEENLETSYARGQRYAGNSLNIPLRHERAFLLLVREPLVPAHDAYHLQLCLLKSMIYLGNNYLGSNPTSPGGG